MTSSSNSRSMLVVALLALCICSSVHAVQDLKTTCASIANYYSKYTPNDSSSYQRCTFCEYAYNSEDSVFGGCNSCPDQSGACSDCRSGYVLHDSLCIPCGKGVQKCTITNDVSKDESIAKLISDIASSSTIIGERNKKLAKINAYAKYLGLRASSCSWSSQSDSGTMVELGSFCLNIENCQEATKKDNTVTCTACKPGHFLENGKCSTLCQANLITYDESSKYTFSNIFTCNGCNSKACAACPSGTVEVTSPNDDVMTALKSSSADSSLMTCQKCPSSCSSCKLDSFSNVSCVVCQDGYYNDSGSCKKCSLQADFLLFPEQISLESQSVLICSGPAFSSFTWSASTFYQNDAFNAKIGTHFTTYNQKVHNCGVGAQYCELLSSGTVLSATSCIDGYILSLKKDSNSAYECVKCSSVVKNSLLCKNDKTLGYYPYICALGKNMGVTYSDSYYLQVNLADYNKKDSVYDAQTEIHDTNNWCQLNSGNCKTMVTVVQTGQNFSFGQCSSCFEDSDIPVENRIIEQDFFRIEKPITCLRCTDLYSNVASCNVHDRTLIPKTCQSSFYLDIAADSDLNSSSTYSCKACSSSCATCSDASTCTSCPATHYLSSSKTCIALPTKSNDSGSDGSTPVTSTLKPIEGCTQTTQVTENQVDNLSCVTCKSEYNIVAKSDQSAIKICQLKTENVNCSTVDSEGNCTACVQDLTTNYLLLKGKCITIPAGCSKYDGTTCSICAYGYKLSNGTCLSCYSSVETPTYHIEYDCPVSLQNNNDKATDDTGYGVKSSHSCIIAAITSILIALLAFL